MAYPTTLLFGNVIKRSKAHNAPGSNILFLRPAGSMDQKRKSD